MARGELDPRCVTRHDDSVRRRHARRQGSGLLHADAIHWLSDVDGCRCAACDRTLGRFPGDATDRRSRQTFRTAGPRAYTPGDGEPGGTWLPVLADLPARVGRAPGVLWIAAVRTRGGGVRDWGP